MPSLLPGHDYDIFISYRHNDNRSGWVTEFVKALQEELAATIKEPLSVYYDTNPHDGLLETHNVDKSLEGKLKCLIFIPILSQTYCDPKSFAWQHEFCAFNQLAQQDELGRDIRLTNGNVASRILPIKIHDLDEEDKSIIENEIGGVLRAIAFIYKEPGVNRPLIPTDNRNENHNHTDYRNQVNKVANAVKEIVVALSKRDAPADTLSSVTAPPLQRKSKFTGTAALSSVVIIILLLVGGYFAYNLFSKPGNASTEETLTKSIAVMPFDDLSPEGDQEWFADGLSEEIINTLYTTPGLQVRGRNSSFAYKNKGLTISEYANALQVSYVLEGSVRKFGDSLRVTAQLINALDDDHLWSSQYDIKAGDVFAIQSIIANNVVRALNIFVDEGERERMFRAGTSNPVAYEYFLKGRNRYYRWHDSYDPGGLWEANLWFDKAIQVDSTIALAYYFRSDAFSHYFYDDMSAPEGKTLPKQVAWQEYLWNLGKAIQHEQNPSTRMILEIELKARSGEWAGLAALGKQLPENYSPSPFISSEDIIPFVATTAGPSKALDVLEADILLDPENLWLWHSYACILASQGDMPALKKVVERLSKLSDSEPYFAMLFLNRLFEGTTQQTLDSILQNNVDIPDVGWLYNYWTGAIQNNFVELKAEVDRHERPVSDIGPNAMNAFWQRGDQATADSLVRALDQTFTSGTDFTEFYLKLASNFCYHIPFHMEAAPRFKKKLEEAGIDPKRFKLMPKFEIQ